MSLALFCCELLVLALLCCVISHICFTQGDAGLIQGLLQLWQGRFDGLAYGDMW